MEKLTNISKEPEAIIQNEILPIIATYYPYSLGEIKALFDRQEQQPSFDWVIEVCEHALGQGFGDLESAERDMLKGLEDAGIEEKAMEAAFKEIEEKKRIDELQDENRELRQEIERLQKAISLSGVAKTMALFTSEIERLQAKCNALIDALGESDHASYYPHLTDREGVNQ